MNPIFKPDFDVLTDISRSLGIKDPQHFEALVLAYRRVLTEEVAAAEVLFANIETGKLHFLLISKGDSMMRIVNRGPDISDEAQVMLVKRIVDENISDNALIHGLVEEVYHQEHAN